MFGGRNSSFPPWTYYDELHSYDPEDDTWSQLSVGPQGRFDFAMAVLDGIVYICGGEIDCTHCHPPPLPCRVAGQCD